jgi:hypothetical protein
MGKLISSGNHCT